MESPWNAKLPEFRLRSFVSPTMTLSLHPLSCSAFCQQPLAPQELVLNDTTDNNDIVVHDRGSSNLRTSHDKTSLTRRAVSTANKTLDIVA